MDLVISVNDGRLGGEPGCRVAGSRRRSAEELCCAVGPPPLLLRLGCEDDGSRMGNYDLMSQEGGRMPRGHTHKARVVYNQKKESI